MGTPGVEAQLQVVVESNVDNPKRSFGSVRSQGGPWERVAMN
ncbi:hypothetical protein Pan54_40870 [Rubinisphaera italica]|uniref:Uncharacterized protein n=1 Tax=Rubinisphaera italica TaxID=2527969 RepID=A0A5C5XKF1_9PLAN|nr:hypothetical protein Pan54_40870 [Rubinisphaera italica]